MLVFMFMQLQKLKWSVTKNLLNHLQSEQVQTWLSVRSATVTQGVYTLQVKKQFLCSENIKKYLEYYRNVSISN